MTTFGRRGLLGMAGGALCSALGGVPGSARADTVASARQPIVAFYVALDKIMRAGRATPFQARFDMLAPVVDAAFDLDTILRVSVGLKWGTLEEASRVRLAAVFRKFTVATYVANFDAFDGERFDVLADTKVSGADQIVQSRLIPGSGDPIKLDYLMRTTQSGWRVVDVLLDGTISRVAVQRSDFRAVLAKGDAEALSAMLERKTVELAGGKAGG